MEMENLKKICLELLCFCQQWAVGGGGIPLKIPAAKGEMQNPPDRVIVTCVVL